jgi:sugar phosphate isomerase/epimerase
MSEMIDLAVDLGGEYFIFHPGRLAFYSLGKNEITFMENRFPGKHADFLKTSLESVLDHAAGRITVCMENTYYLAPGLRHIISSLAETHGLRLAWDVGYTEVLPARRKATMLKFFNENIRKVSIAHIHDITDAGAHKMLGTGLLNVSAYLEIIRVINADIILEIFPEKDLLESLKYIKNLAPKLNAT